MPFDRQPILTSELLTLRPLQPEDHDDLYAAACDPLVWELHPSRDRHKPEVFDPYFEDAIQSGGALAVIENSTGTIIGTSRFHGYDEAKREIEIGWTFLIRRCWGGRFNSEMKRLMLTHAFQFVDSVIFVIGPNNFRSQKAVEKIGGIAEAPRPDGSLVFRIVKP